MIAGLAIAALVAFWLLGCTGSKTDDPSDNLSVTEVENAFASAGLKLVRQKSGAFRVPETGEPRVCGWLHSADFWIGVSVCRRWDADYLPLRRLRGGRWRTFDDANKLLRSLSRPASSGGLSKRFVPHLIVDYRNLTLSYLGRDATRVRMIADALRQLGLD